MIDGTRSQDGRWVWRGDQWRQLSEDGRYWWDGQRWQPDPGNPPQARTARGAGSWLLVVLGAGLLAIGLLRVVFEVLGGIASGTLAYGLGRATISLVLFVFTGLVLVRRVHRPLPRCA